MSLLNKGANSINRGGATAGGSNRASAASPNTSNTYNSRTDDKNRPTSG